MLLSISHYVVHDLMLFTIYNLFDYNNIIITGENRYSLIRFPVSLCAYVYTCVRSCVVQIHLQCVYPSYKHVPDYELTGSVNDARSRLWKSNNVHACDHVYNSLFTFTMSSKLWCDDLVIIDGRLETSTQLYNLVSFVWKLLKTLTHCS